MFFLPLSKTSIYSFLISSDAIDLKKGSFLRLEDETLTETVMVC